MSQSSGQIDEPIAKPVLDPLTDLTVEAIYQKGVFQPLQPLGFDSGTRLKVLITSVQDVSPTAKENAEAPPPPALRPKGKNMSVTPNENVAPVETRPRPIRPPLAVIIVGIGLLAILAFFLFRGLRGTTTAGNAGGPNQSTQRNLSGPPLITPAQAAGSPLAAPSLVAEIKIPSNDGKPVEPRDVAVDSHGNIFVACNSDGTVRKFDSQGNPAGSWGGTAKNGEPMFKELFGIVIDPSNDSVYVLDSGAGAVLHFDAQGNLKGDMLKSHLYYPRGLALGQNGEILVADTGGQKIVRASAAQGNIVGEFGHPPESSGDVCEPVDVVASSNGETFLFDARNDRIQHFTADGTLDKQWAVTGKIAARDSGHLALDQHDRLYFAVPSKKEINVFNKAGEILATWPQESGESPVGLFVDKENMYVTYPESGMVRKFKLPQTQQ